LHWDHLDLPTLRRLGTDQRIFVPRGAGDWLTRRGFSQVRELAVDDRGQVGDVSISAVPADHAGRRPPFGPTAEAVGYMLGGEHRIYFPGDTDLFDGMAELADDLDVALMPIWGWGSTLGAGHLDPIRAAEATRRLHPRIVIPIHWGTFHPIGMGRHGTSFLEEPPKHFASAVHLVAPETSVRILAPGETLIL
jgi:L-ascorbate metabolism protein UlaG (beta-lactamase superfamily)